MNNQSLPLQVLAVIDNPGEPLAVVVNGTQGRIWQVHLDEFRSHAATRAAHDAYAKVKPEPAGTLGIEMADGRLIWAVVAPSRLLLPKVPSGRLRRSSELAQLATLLAQHHERYLSGLGLS